MQQLEGAVRRKIREKLRSLMSVNELEEFLTDIKVLFDAYRERHHQAGIMEDTSADESHRVRATDLDDPFQGIEEINPREVPREVHPTVPIGGQRHAEERPSVPSEVGGESSEEAIHGHVQRTPLEGVLHQLDRTFREAEPSAAAIREVAERRADRDRHARRTPSTSDEINPIDQALQGSAENRDHGPASEWPVV